MAMDPNQLIQQLMQQQGGGAPMPAGGAPPPPTGGPPTDEAMLDTVHNAMGKRSGDGPPPGSGMKWENLDEDQAALEQDPSPENIAAFVQYWGEDKLPTNISSGDNEPDTDQAGDV